MQQTKIIMEELARARNHYHRHDVMRCMVSLATALKQALEVKVFGREKSLVENAVLEVVQLLNRTSEVRDYCSGEEGLVLARGDLKSLFKSLLFVIRTIREEQKKESLEQTRARKLQMDNLLLRGHKAVDHRHLDDAEEAYQEAVSLYVDEHKLFYVIGSKLLEAGYPRLALKYLSQGLEKDPEPTMPSLAAAKAYALVDEPAKAEGLLVKSLKEQMDPELFLELARVQASQGRLKPAYTNAGRALQMDPALQAARKLRTDLQKQAKKAQQASAAGKAHPPASK